MGVVKISLPITYKGMPIMIYSFYLVKKKLNESFRSCIMRIALVTPTVLLNVRPCKMILTTTIRP